MCSMINTPTKVKPSSFIYMNEMSIVEVMIGTSGSLSCNAVRIMTHEEFAAKHPHPPSPIYVKIDRHSDPVIDRHQETAVMSPILDRIVRDGLWYELISAWQSILVRTSVDGSEQLPDGYWTVPPVRVRRWVRLGQRSDQGPGKGSSSQFLMEGTDMGAVTDGYNAERRKGAVVDGCFFPWNRFGLGQLRAVKSDLLL
ncbi:hypothetical protein DY000_02015296 [Brassica cretica]|uniref:Uncharacterized protein n=1 Tax=Brassica cretica TaxID=69181 RepID=A0ABQ7D1F5_BRACR|nr:hypothetical protein DY000_02015296 [Brassica cretica]